MKDNKFAQLIYFLLRIREKKIPYSLLHGHRNNIIINISVPGERWEAEFSQENSTNVRRYISKGKIYNETILLENFPELAVNFDNFDKLASFIRSLEEKRTPHLLQIIRDESLMVLFFYEEWWELEFFVDGHIEVERYDYDNKTYDLPELTKIVFSRYEDDD
jgi:hypothetical protein